MRLSGRTLLLCLCLLANFAHVSSMDYDDEEEEDHNSKTSVKGAEVPLGEVQTSISIEGMFSDDQFRMLHKHTVLRVMLDGGKQQAIARADGSFTIYDVSEGIHSLDVDAPGWVFEQIKVDVYYKRNELKVRAFFNGDNVGKPVKYPLMLFPTMRVKYFEEREKFDPTVYLKNPMVVMGIIAALMAFVMPKMVENMDPEDVKKLREEMKKSGGTANALKNAMQGS
uniref:ER membrane protein complex subunit 7 beta-sandwich domain-containing protein n=1 Tax=Hanusia phi TaxID=3032 RepID=A0A7S0F1Z4_9CRYP